ncbi:hypothetical protein B5F53_06305 [Blautia sp. An249]|nr:hypothetical protein B5F53_06305 [Blautia sp. An249]
MVVMQQRRNKVNKRKKKCKSMNRIIKNRKLIYLTNALGEETGHGLIPERIQEWYEELGCTAGALLYLVQLDEQYGILAIYEFDEWFRLNLKLSRHRFWKRIREKAKDLCGNEHIENEDVILGKHTGFEECHEIALWFGYPTDFDTMCLKLQYADHILCSGFDVA